MLKVRKIVKASAAGITARGAAEVGRVNEFSQVMRGSSSPLCWRGFTFNEMYQGYFKALIFLGFFFFKNTFPIEINRQLTMKSRQ